MLLVLAGFGLSEPAAELRVIRSELQGTDSSSRPTATEPPMLAELVSSGRLPPLEQRLPDLPATLAAELSQGRYGGALRMLMDRARELRIVYVYSYARLVGYTPELELKPDILERVEVEQGRSFTLHLRPGHRWSDGHLFTSEDFRYWWEDVANNPDLSPYGPPQKLLVQGESPRVTIVGTYQVRYQWSKPNPYFLSQLAGPRPQEIYLPAHYLKQFHQRYATNLEQQLERYHHTSWERLHNYLDNLNRFDNPELPTLQPWILTTQAPAERFIFVRNPYYHRIDSHGRQLPYLDRLVITIADRRIIPAKTGAGESDLQARYLRFDDLAFLISAAPGNDYRVLLWRSGIGAQLALYPNLNCQDEVWRTLNRDPRFRRALSLGIHREELNQVMYYGLARLSNNTVLERSPFWRAEYQHSFADYSPNKANRLLDQIGLTERDGDLRLLPDGRPLELIVEVSGTQEEIDALTLMTDHLLLLGIKLFARPLSLEILRNRIYSGATVMSLARGLDVAVPAQATSPAELAPTAQSHYQWPRWGQYYQSKGQAGEPVDLPAALQLIDLMHQWEASSNSHRQGQIWHQMLAIHAEQQFTIGLVNDVPQPVVVNRDLRNLPQEGLYSYQPGAHFGIYRLDSLWFDR